VVSRPPRRVAGTGPTAVLTRWHLAVVDVLASGTTGVSYTLSSGSLHPRGPARSRGAPPGVCGVRHVTARRREDDRRPVSVTGREGISGAVR